VADIDLSLVPLGDEEGSHYKKFRFGLLKAKLDMKNKRMISLSEAKKLLK